LAKAKKQGKNIAQLVERMSTQFADKEMRFPIQEEDFKAYGEKKLALFESRAKELDCTIPTSYEGVRLSFQSKEVQGWMLLRASLHDPVLVLNLEGKTKEDLKKLESIALKLLED
jgi:phosphomannomutase